MKNNSESNTSKDVKKNNNLLVIIISGIVAVAVIIIVAVLMSSGIFSKKEFNVFRGINELEPGTYVCTNTGSDDASGYISKTGKYESDNYIGVKLKSNTTTSIVIDAGNRLGIEYGDDINIVCKRQ